MKRVKTRLFAVLLSAALLLGTVTAAVAFPDTTGGKYETAVSTLTSLGIVYGNPDGNYRPEAVFTRAQAAQLLCRAFRLAAADDCGARDIGDHWAREPISAVVAAGYLSVDDELSFYPEKAITYAEFVDILMRILNISDTSAITAGTELSEVLYRGDAAILLYNAMQIPFGSKNISWMELNKPLATAAESDELLHFTLTAYFEKDSDDDSSLINAVKLTAQPEAYVWDSEYRAFIKSEAAEDVFKYNFTAIYDTDGDTLGDLVFVVNREDSTDFWDADMHYTDPRAAEDTAYADAHDNSYNIPLGERLIGFADDDGFLDGAVVDYYNIVKPGDLSADTYYPTYDWYNSTSTETLTILTGFKTVQQSTGWSCGMTSALMAVEWFGLRGDLNELDLGALRNTKSKFGAYRWGGATDTQMLIDVFTALNDMEGSDLWSWISTYDYINADGELDENYLSTAWILEMLNSGRPILVGWNAFGGHWQVIIGYDTMGTETTADDVLLLADPYDTTDHRNDGVTIQSYERLFWDWTQGFDRDFSLAEGWGLPVIFAPFPSEYDPTDFAPQNGNGLRSEIANPNWNAQINTSDDMLIPYDKTADALTASDYDETKNWLGGNGLGGPASDDYYRQFEISNSPYYLAPDFYTAKNLSDTLLLLEGFQTSQQASEWTCGPASLRMVLNWFDLLNAQDEFTLAQMRERDIEGATTLDGMVQIFDAQPDEWLLITSDDMDDDGYVGEYNLYENLIPYCLEKGIPVIIGWNEWGGHWQVIIGYDDMGTDATQDDVLILADPYDTTDHRQDGYVIESFERLVYGWGAAFDERGSEVFIIAVPLELTTTVDFSN